MRFSLFFRRWPWEGVGRGKRERKGARGKERKRGRGEGEGGGRESEGEMYNEYMKRNTNRGVLYQMSIYVQFV